MLTVYNVIYQNNTTDYNKITLVAQEALIKAYVACSLKHTNICIVGGLFSAHFAMQLKI